MQQQISFLDSQFGKMFPEPSAPIKEQTSEPSSRASATSGAESFLFLNLRKANGSLLGASWEMAQALPGGSMMLNFGESPSVARESTLSQILDLNAPEKYSLSVRACQGILNRAKKRGKELPAMLLDALTEVISSCGETDAEADG